MWTNTVAGDVARYDNWERFEITDNSELTFEDSIAGYWTHLSPDGWYVDVVAKYAWLNSSSVHRGIGGDLDGNTPKSP